ncbi:DUF3096 domain-containing protein [Candidatus Woesebacteria bacterium]|nr:DUF3096 domain-containing protein [Candidatus Woesebacteria bacterium]
MNLGIVDPVLSVIVGILILIFPQFLNYFVALYLIVAGLLGLGIF